MKYGTMVFLILAFCSFVGGIVSLSSIEASGFLGIVALISALIAFLQMVAWILIAWMWETMMQ